MKTEIVFAAYRPKAGNEKEFESLLNKHVPTLRELGLATERAPIIVRAKDGTFIEVFEWHSAEAAQKAHEHPVVAKIWEQMGQIGEFAALNSLEEATKPFPHFKPI